MRIAVTGAAGLFGKGLTQIFPAKHDTVPLTRQDADICDGVRMRELLTKIAPDVVVHAAALPDIDEAEEKPDLAFKVNAEATRTITDIARNVGAALAFISTDAVFDGKKGSPYVETDPVNPVSVYGRTKVKAEEHVRKYSRHWIFRVSVLFGPGKANFVNKGLCKAMGKEPYVVAEDQIGSATYTIDAAEAMLRVFESGVYGTFHLCNQGACSRYELARKAAEIGGLDPALVAGKPMREMNRPGPRLEYSVMEMRRLAEVGVPLPRAWEDALRAYIETVQLGEM